MSKLLFESKQEILPDNSPVTIVKVIGPISSTTVRSFENGLMSFFYQGIKNLILNFSKVYVINSTGMGILVKCLDKFAEREGNIKLADVSERSVALFDMLGLLSLIEVYETEEEAIDSFFLTKKPPPPPPPLKSAPIPFPKDRENQ